MGRPKKNKVYLAGPWFDEKSKVIHDVAKDIIRNIDGIDYFFPDEQCISKEPFDTFRSNVDNIKDCTYLIALIDVKDVGTAWEIGMAYQLKKRIILVGVNEESFQSKTNLMLAYTGMCITIGNLEKLLKGEPYHSAFLSRKWEDIE